MLNVLSYKQGVSGGDTLQLQNTNKEDINKLLDFAKQNHLELSVPKLSK